MFQAIVGSAIPGLVVWSGVRKVEQASKQRFTMASASLPAFSFLPGFLPCLPFVMDSNLKVR